MKKVILISIIVATLFVLSLSLIVVNIVKLYNTNHLYKTNLPESAFYCSPDSVVNDTAKFSWFKPISHIKRWCYETCSARYQFQDSNTQEVFHVDSNNNLICKDKNKAIITLFHLMIQEYDSLNKYRNLYDNLLSCQLYFSKKDFVISKDNIATIRCGVYKIKGDSIKFIK